MRLKRARWSFDSEEMGRTPLSLRRRPVGPTDTPRARPDMSALLCSMQPGRSPRLQQAADLRIWVGWGGPVLSGPRIGPPIGPRIGPRIGTIRTQRILSKEAEHHREAREHQTRIESTFPDRVR